MDEKMILVFLYSEQKSHTGYWIFTQVRASLREHDVRHARTRHLRVSSEDI
jgi:hypothetical protein